MDLKTKYMGFELAHPFIAGSSPLADTVDGARKLEDAGSPAIILHSLFEEQLMAESMATHKAMDGPANSYAEALSYFSDASDFNVGPEDYLEHLRKVKAAVSVPVFASLNGVRPGTWLDFARLAEEAGADALELNIYALHADPEVPSDKVEWETLELVRAVKKLVKIPVAVKLSPFYSALTNFAKEMGETGADALVLFNRFYQPDIDVENLEVKRDLHLSTSSELLLRLRWLALVYGKTSAALAVTGGVHTAVDGLKAIMAGADVVQVVSTLLDGGLGKLAELRDGLSQWLDEHEYESLDQARGSMSHVRSGSPEAFERANYLKILHSWHGAGQQ